MTGLRSIDTLRVARGDEPHVLFACSDKFDGKAPQCSPYCTVTYEEKLMCFSRAVDNSYRAGAGDTAPVAATTTPLVPQSLDYAGRAAAPRRSDARLAE